MSHRCQVCYLSDWYFLQIPSGGGGANATPACASCEKGGKVVTIVGRPVHHNSPVITCQGKRKPAPPGEPEALEMSPDV